MHEGHEHSHPHEAPKEAGESLALLTYMLDHNRHHAEELHDVCHKLEDMGLAAAAEKLGAALEAYRTGNDALAQALDALEEK
jgi:hypothetical protein